GPPSTSPTRSSLWSSPHSSSRLSRPSASLARGALLRGDLLRRHLPSLEPEQLDLRIAYEAEHLLVVDKPAGIVVHPSAGHTSGTLVHGLLGHAVAGGEEAERPGIVHRLDRDTSGLL